MKRILPILLCCVLLIGVFAVPAMAASSTTIVDLEKELTSVGSGDDGDIWLEYDLPYYTDVTWEVFDYANMRGYDFVGQSFPLFNNDLAGGLQYNLYHFGVVCYPYSDNKYFDLSFVDPGGLIRFKPHVYLNFGTGAVSNNYTIQLAYAVVTYYASDLTYVSTSRYSLKFENTWFGDSAALQFDRLDLGSTEYRLTTDFENIQIPDTAEYFQIHYQFENIQFENANTRALTLGLGDYSTMVMQVSPAWFLSHKFDSVTGGLNDIKAVLEDWYYNGALPPGYDSIEAYLAAEGSIWDRLEHGLNQSIQMQNNAIADLLFAMGGFAFLSGAVNYVFNGIPFLQSLAAISFALGIVAVLLGIVITAGHRVGKSSSKYSGKE